MMRYTDALTLLDTIKERVSSQNKDRSPFAPTTEAGRFGQSLHQRLKAAG